ncbi:tyrosinase family protein [Noviherbaspirillum pedocola]|uniref:Tyrosinase family protein n=1 Tax=Noviherbaspirillum pedocola TaxID=2801341 RepID=A0A934SST7_9BURK|nr:tyrosinase family protein [Noviherbaspirillum pedocola]MBK4734962.1 tyrosinase family protein [Noviherbaspirillum pedocola]
MTSSIISRRTFLKGSASAIALASLPRFAQGQTTRVRLEWQQFKTTPQYTSFLNALRTMRANTNSGSMSSWSYWVNVHTNYCPHTAPYFLAWHRGYLYYLERQLRTVSGDNSLNLPYWDYYSYPRMPAEFLDSSTGNPLYVSQRTGSNVYNALTLTPFGSSVWNFQRGTTNAFEPQLESAPHNPVHNLIGGYMANINTSPMDPIFYLHHCNIDRLWHAWALPDGKGIPYTTNPYNSSTSSSYWAGSFTYASGLTMSRYMTYYPGWLGYDYANDNKPTSLPPSAKASSPFKLVQAQMGNQLVRPTVANIAATAPRTVSNTARSLGGRANLVLTEASVSASMPLDAAAMQTLQATLAAAANNNPAGGPQSVKVVLDNVQVLGNAANAGFFYNVYINLPPAGDVTGERQRYFLGTFGPFEASIAAHHGGAMLEFPATEVLAGLAASGLQEVSVSFVRVSGENAPQGQVLRVGEVRVEVSTEPPWDRSPQVTRPAGQCYC